MRQQCCQAIPFLFIKRTPDCYVMSGLGRLQILDRKPQLQTSRDGKTLKGLSLWDSRAVTRGDGRCGAAWMRCSGRCCKVIRMSGSLTPTTWASLGFVHLSELVPDEACHRGLFESEYLVEPPMGITESTRNIIWLK